MRYNKYDNYIKVIIGKERRVNYYNNNQQEENLFIKKDKYIGGIYLRLSVEEVKELRKTGESVSSSIKTQEIMLRECFAEKGIDIADVYIDDGFSGQRSDDRCEFQRMTRDLKYGKINTVGTKDMARLGRDLIDTCTLVQRTYPQARNKIYCVS